MSDHPAASSACPQMEPVRAKPAPRSFTAGDVQLYRACDHCSEILIYGMVVFSPWAFGSTESWSIWVMNCAGYLLGCFLLLKLAIRFRGYRAARWLDSHPATAASRFTLLLATLTGLLLVYCLTSALNARATFDERSLTFAYHQCISWLPHSFDSTATWFAFWTCLGLACFFWSMRDWLLGKSSDEERVRWQNPSLPRSANGSGDILSPNSEPHSNRLSVHIIALPLPARLRRLLWILAINGALLGLEAIIQRTANSPKLLFLVQPRIHQTAEGQFGPYAYRSNAAQYFNLLWPVALGFWWTLNRSAQRGRSSHNLLLIAAAIMAACTIISSSRAGAFVCLAIVLLAALVFGVMEFATHGQRQLSSRGTTCEPNRPADAQSPADLERPRRIASRTGSPRLRPLALFFVGATLLGLMLGWKQLRPRLTYWELQDGFAGREQLSELARPIANDFPWFGTGPGSFETVSQLYARPDVWWPAQLHNDWLETRITFGRVGSALIALGFICVVSRWWARGAIHGGRRFVVLLWLALAGCLIHARFDFPFQIHSTLFLFVLWCAVLFTFSRRTAIPP